MTKILLADDHAIAREGLKTFIQNIIPHSNFDEAHDGSSALKKIKRTNYALIILDINMPATDSFNLVSNILAIKPRSKILMLSMNSEEVYAKKFLHLGALGYLGKEASGDEIRQAIETVMSNKRYLSKSLKDVFAESALGKNTNNQNPFELLSSRELEITGHLIKGERVSQISSFLHIHTSTVGTFKARIFDKLHCKNIVEISKLAIIYNIFNPINEPH